MSALRVLASCAALLAAVGACAKLDLAGEQQFAAPVIFTCGSTRVDAEFGGDTLLLRIDGRSHRLRRAISASGARYSGGADAEPIAFWDKGDEAVLTLRGRTFPTCRRVDGAASAAGGGATAAPATGYVARGQEPGWSLAVEAERVTFSPASGATIVAGAPERETAPTGLRYTARGAEGEIVADVVNRLCRDSMSGQAFPDIVTVTVQGRTLKGCGGDPAQLLQGGEWVVEAAEGFDLPAEGRGTLNFNSDGRVAGVAFCNNYSAPYSIGGEGMRIARGITTRKACAADLMEAEQRFLTLLAAVAAYELWDDGSLLLKAGSGQSLMARRK